MSTMVTIRCAHNDPNEEALIRELVDLDLRYMPGATAENMGSVEYWSRCKGADFKFIAEEHEEREAGAGTVGATEGWVSEAPRIVGYLSVYTLNEEGERKVLDGTIDDAKLEGLLVLDPKPGNAVILYMVGAVVKPEYQGRGIGLKLIEFARGYFSANGYSYENMYGIAWTEGGEALLKRAGGMQIGLDSNGHRMFVLR